MSDVNLSINVKDAYVTRCIDALIDYQGLHARLEVYVKDETGTMVVRQDAFGFELPEKGTDTAKVFGENVVKELLKALVRCYEKGVDTDRYKIEVAAVEAPSQDVPDGMVE